MTASGYTIRRLRVTTHPSRHTSRRRHNQAKMLSTTQVHPSHRRTGTTTQLHPSHRRTGTTTQLHPNHRWTWTTTQLRPSHRRTGTTSFPCKHGLIGQTLLLVVGKIEGTTTLKYFTKLAVNTLQTMRKALVDLQEQAMWLMPHEGYEAQDIVSYVGTTRIVPWLDGQFGRA